MMKKDRSVCLSLNRVLAAGLLLIMVLSGCRRGTYVTSGVNKATRDSLSFLVVGDWGKGKGAQRPVARSMNKAAKEHGTSFIISTGDNFYYRGVSSTTDKQWRKKFERVYWRRGHQVPWYPVLGNHDYGRSPQAQVDYSAHSPRWKMPARYYEKRESVDSATAALFLFLDTSPFLRGYHTSFMADLALQDTGAQKAWMAKTLAGSRADWKIVVGHHPVYSAGLHGSTPELGTSFPELFKKEGVQLYLSGHDHSLQYLQEGGQGPAYLISAGGSERRRVRSHPHAQFARSMTGFLVVTLYSDRAQFYFYNRRGNMVYSSVIKK